MIFKIIANRNAKLILSYSVFIIGLAGTYLGIFGFFLPRINIEPTEIDESNKMYFKIQNQGSVDINDVKYRCILHGYRFAERSEINENITRLFKLYDPRKFIVTEPSCTRNACLDEFGEQRDKHQVNRILKVNEIDSDNTCDFYIRGIERLRDGQIISVMIDYRPSFIPFLFNQVTSYKLVKLDKKHKWIPIATSITKYISSSGPFDSYTPYRHRGVNFPKIKDTSPKFTKECLVNGIPTEYEFPARVPEDYMLAGKFNIDALSPDEYKRFIKSDQITYVYIKKDENVICQYGKITAIYASQEPVLFYCPMSLATKLFDEKERNGNNEEFIDCNAQPIVPRDAPQAERP